MNKFTLNRTDVDKFKHNLLMFLRPVAILYIGAVVGVISSNHGVVSVTSFIPNEFVLGGMVLYILNAILDYLNKLTK